MRPAFYDSLSYRAMQSAITKRNQEKGLYENLKKPIARVCLRPDCSESFLVQKSNPKQYCSQSCAAIVNNSKRTWSASVKQKISRALTGKKSPLKGSIQVPRMTTICRNPACKRLFSFERHRSQKFCSVQCAMKVTGGRPTSPKASRGKAGVRSDVHPTIYFYSRWEANMARLYSFLGVSWEYEPRSFDIGNQMYTPDFYLPETDTYIEVKNFWSSFSKTRDTKFRETNPHLTLKVILKEEYLVLEKQYAHLIPQWEYKNSAAP